MTLQTDNTTRWQKCHISAEMGPAFEKVSNRLKAADAKARYQAVSKKTGVPWWFIAVVHEREASQNWNTQLGQGDPLSRKSTHVPKGRGPFKTWEEGAVDALVNCPPFAAKNTDWSPGGALTMLEKYNGLGYANRGLPSPYLWAGTDQYTKGKFVRDGVFDPTVVDTQLGCAGLLKFMGVFQKDHLSGPSAAIVTSGGVYATFSQFIHNHPYDAVAIAIAIGAFVWWVVHSIRNKNA